jgi:hypothetical protein
MSLLSISGTGYFNTFVKQLDNITINTKHISSTGMSRFIIG